MEFWRENNKIETIKIAREYVIQMFELELGEGSQRALACTK